MDIVLWNIERACAATPTKRAAVQARLHSIQADILVLTEASAAVSHPELLFQHGSMTMPALDTQTCWLGKPLPYRTDEMRTRILSRYPLVRSYATADSLTNSCADLETAEGDVRVLAIIVGVLNTKTIWERDLENLRRDLDAHSCPHLILAGDFNVSLPDGLYRERREKLMACYREYGLEWVPSTQGGVIDHVFVGTDIRLPEKGRAEITQVPRRTSDHPLVRVTGLKMT